MAALDHPPGSGRLESELDFRQMDSVPLAQVREGAEALLTMDVSDDLMPLRLHVGEKPAVPQGAEDLVDYYEKQLAAAQLVQHRLQKQFNQLAEEKLALEASLCLQTSALQQQLAAARDCAERALSQAEKAQQEVQDAHASAQEAMEAVTRLAKVLDTFGATDELTHSCETVAHSTQRTAKAVASFQESAQTLLRLQLDFRDACQVSPLLTAMSVGSPRTSDAVRAFEDTIRLRSELEESKRREQNLEAEMQAAQDLFKRLEYEVIALQHDQAQLQVSQEELVAARDQLLLARQSLAASDLTAAPALTQGLDKLDAHLVSIRNFLESLSMPQPPSLPESSGGGPLQLSVGRSADGNTTAFSVAASDDRAPSASSRRQTASPRQPFRNLTVRTSRGERNILHVGGNRGSDADFPYSTEELTFRLRHEQDAGDEDPLQHPPARRVARSPMEAEIGASREDQEHLSLRLAGLTAERDLLRRRVGELESFLMSLEVENGSLKRERTRQISMAAAAGAAGAAAAVAAVTTGSPPPSRTPSLLGVNMQPSGTGRSRVEAGSAREVLDQFMSEAAGMAAERDATRQRAQHMDSAVQRAERLEEQLDALSDLLHQGVAGQDRALQELESMVDSIAASREPPGRQFPGEKAVQAARMHRGAPGAASRAAADPMSRPVSEAGLARDVSAAGSPPLLASGLPPSRSRRRRSDTSGNRLADEGEEFLSEPGESVAEMSRGYARSSVALQSSYQSFTSEAPLLPTRRYTDASEPPTYLLDPTEPLEELLGETGVHNSGAALLCGRGGTSDCRRDAVEQLRSSSGNAGAAIQMAEMQNLQAAVCGLLVSKIVTCVELHAESEQRIEALQAAHKVELVQLREEHAADIGRLEALLAEGAAAVRWDAERLASGRSDKSTRVSDDGLRNGQYEADLLQHIASLEVQIAELEERQQQLISGYEARLQQLQQEHASQCAALTSALVNPGCEDDPDEAAAGLDAVERPAGQNLLSREQHDSVILELRAQHAAELQEHHSQLAAHLTERSSQLEADKAADIARLQARHDEGMAHMRAEHAEALAQFRVKMAALEGSRDADREAHGIEAAALQELIGELRGQLSELNTELAELKASFHGRLSEELDHHHATAEELRRNLEDREGDLMMRESLISELRGQLQQLQSEKEVEEQSFQSLLSTKAWMTDEIRSLQASLKESAAKLARTESELTAAKAAATSRSTLPASSSLRDSDVGHGAPDRLGQRETILLHGSREVRSAERAHADTDSAISMAADQLAEAAMQAAVAEARLENMQLQQGVGSLLHGGSGEPVVSTQSAGSTGGQVAQQTDLMMETVVLHGELDELRAKYRTLQAQVDAVADELAYAAMRAALAELQLEEVRLLRIANVSAFRVESPRAQQQERTFRSPKLAGSNDVMASMCSLTSTPGRPTTSAAEPNLMGSESFRAVQQARQLYKELRAVRRALGDLMSTNDVTESAFLRQELSSVWEVVAAAQDHAADVVQILLRQQHEGSQTKLSVQDRSFPGEKDGQAIGELHDRPGTETWLHAEMARARDVYRDACEVYDMLRSDAEDVNGLLWRWNVKLHQQLSATEQARMQAPAGGVPGQQHALEALLSKKEAYIRSVENQVSELQAGLQTAQAKLLQRDGQVAALQDMFVQLSEQLAVFEGAVVRCEVLSADLVNKTETKGA